MYTGYGLANSDRTTKALSCFFNLVNVESGLAHQPVTPVCPATYSEGARYLAAHRSFQAVVDITQ